MRRVVQGRVGVKPAGDGLFIPPGEAQEHKARMLTDVTRVVPMEKRRTAAIEPGGET